MGRAFSETEKKWKEIFTARFVRRANGRLTKRECAKLGRLYGVDVHWKYLGVSGDQLVNREPNGYATTFKTLKESGHVGYLRDLPTNLFWWYGPTGGYIWPGDRLVWDPEKRTSVVVAGPG